MLFHRSYDDNTKSSLPLERKYSRLFDWGHHLSREGNNLPRYMRKAERINEQTFKKKDLLLQRAATVFLSLIFQILFAVRRFKCLLTYPFITVHKFSSFRWEQTWSPDAISPIALFVLQLNGRSP